MSYIFTTHDKIGVQIVLNFDQVSIVIYCLRIILNGNVENAN